MKTATLVRTLEGWVSDARLYKLSEATPYNHYGRDDKRTDYVIISAVVALFSGPETFIFPATEVGEPINMLEMTGSFRGGLDHEHALEGMGFVLAESKETVH